MLHPNALGHPHAPSNTLLPSVLGHSMHPAKQRTPQPRGAALTLTMASLVCAMSEMTPSVMMRSTKYWEPSGTAAAELRDSQ